MTRLRIRRPDGGTRVLAGTGHAHWEDDHYERLKARMKRCDNAPQSPITESGFVYDIVEGLGGRWYSLRAEVLDVGYPSGKCEAGEPEVAVARQFGSEAELLTTMREELDPENPCCPVRNLLGDWERFDLLHLWLEEVS